MTIWQLAQILNCNYHTLFGYIWAGKFPKPDIRLNLKQHVYSQQALNDIKKSDWAVDRFPQLLQLKLEATSK